MFGVIDLLLVLTGVIFLGIGGLFIFAGFTIDGSPDEKRKALVKGGILAVIGVILIIATSFLTIIPAGYVGVKDTFGVVDSDVFQSGLYLKNPFTNVIPMSYQTMKYIDVGTPGQTDVATIDGLSNEGLKITMGIAVNYHIDTTKAPDIYRKIGMGYQDIVLKPPVHSVPRDIISKYDAKTLYSAGVSADNADRARIEQELLDGISKGILDEKGVNRGIVIERVYLRDIVLPQTLLNSIEAKLKMEQEIQQKKFEVQKQEMEANRMRAEAQGIADANKIIANSLTQSYIEWYTIEMMKSHPGATYFIPIGEDGRYHPDPVLPLPAVK
jgi:regulator of protease activity HflC (stomatin/prohibitin superfamily)